MIISYTILGLVISLLIIIMVPHAIKLFIYFKGDYRSKNVGVSSKIRLIHQLKEAIEYLSKHKIGAIITIENNDNIDNLRTDGVILDANISSSLIIALFNKTSPLHDGAVVIRSNKIIYAGTYYKITRKSIDNKYGARHRAGMGISEVSDATTIIVSEETGSVSISKNSSIIQIPISQLQEKLTFFTRE